MEGYYRKDGTYVRSHYRSAPDGNPYNNYSYPGNTNPYTGEVATGKPSTYLKNYYRTYPGKSSSSIYYTNYNGLMIRQSYSGIESGFSYTMYNSFGATTGYINYVKDDVFQILDKDKKHIGYLKTFRNGRKYDVYDLYGNIVSSNKQDWVFSMYGVLLIATSVVYIIASLGSG